MNGAVGASGGATGGPAGMPEDPREWGFRDRRLRRYAGAAPAAGKDDA